MESYYQVINADVPRDAAARKRVWMEAGRPVVLGPQLTMTAFFDIVDEKYQLHARVDVPNRAYSYALPVGSLLDLSAWCGLKALPVAIEFNAYARPTRVLIEFNAVNSRAQWASI